MRFPIYFLFCKNIGNRAKTYFHWVLRLESYQELSRDSLQCRIRARQYDLVHHFRRVRFLR